MRRKCFRAAALVALTCAMVLTCMSRSFAAPAPAAEEGEPSALAGVGDLGDIIRRKPVVVQHPLTQTAFENDTVTFTVQASTASAVIHYTWVYLAPGSTDWKVCPSSGDSTSYTVTAHYTLHGYKYRCMIVDGGGSTVTTNAATLFVRPKITTQPEDAVATVSSKAKFTRDRCKQRFIHVCVGLMFTAAQL